MALFLSAVVTATLAQNRQPEEPSWAPKPVQPTKWVPPNKPHTRLSEVKAKHKGKNDWREVAVSDDHLHAEYISMAAGGKTLRRFHPDTRVVGCHGWTTVLRSKTRSHCSHKGSMVQVPCRPFTPWRLWGISLVAV
jgi:hypothetical protein